MQKNTIKLIHKYITLLLITCISAGCSISRTKPDNYLPEKAERNKDYYMCYNNAQYSYTDTSLGFNRNYASVNTNSGVKANREHIKTCMSSQGYSLRSMSTTEAVFSTLTFPLMLSFMILGTEPDFF
ncbi:MAG: hypothetical protein WCI06_09500 [Methylococcaceae bacterium]